MSRPEVGCSEAGQEGSRPVGIRRLLVANRGEIARRVFATCRRLGIETVAVHSDADAGLPFVAEADLAVRLPGDAPGETYLRGDLVIEAARRTGADAIHPGYGFLSESADFARAVLDAGLVWVGPRPESIERMGSKVEAKRLMREAGVPVLADLDPGTATGDDLPLLVKASAGGGGRGMRVVRTLADLPTEVEAARAEAASAFGDGTVFVEPYVEHGRHVEVQVWGDHAGEHVSVLGARDCSVQRRHQKVVEEAPPPGLAEATLEAMYDAARAAAAAISYVGAGTVEFLVDVDRVRAWEAAGGSPGGVPPGIFFLEMNTRLQVEHPVTEAVHGVDLVELQLAAAEDPSVRRVPVAAPRGHAIEVRLYAEDPAADHQPQTGVLSRFEVPDVDAELEPLRGYGVRLDAGFTSGDAVGTHYDAMLAKLIVWAPDRPAAVRRLASVLRRARIHGPTTNRDQLVAVLADPRFAAGEVSTALLASLTDRDGAAGEPDRSDPARAWARTAAALAVAAHDASRRTVQQGIPAGWRNVTSQPQVTRLADGDQEHAVAWWGTRDGYVVDGAEVVTARPDLVVLEVDGVRTRWEVAIDGDRVHVDGPATHAGLRRVPRFVDPADQVATGSLLAPMPGSVVTVLAEAGQHVSAGDPVLVLEAMKMQHTVAAPADGVVSDLPVSAGHQVAAGDVLAVVSPGSNDERGGTP